MNHVPFESSRIYLYYYFTFYYIILFILILFYLFYIIYVCYIFKRSERIYNIVLPHLASFYEVLSRFFFCFFFAKLRVILIHLHTLTHTHLCINESDPMCALQTFLVHRHTYLMGYRKQT